MSGSSSMVASARGAGRRGWHWAPLLAACSLFADFTAAANASAPCGFGDVCVAQSMSPRRGATMLQTKSRAEPGPEPALVQKKLRQQQVCCHFQCDAGAGQVEDVHELYPPGTNCAVEKGSDKCSEHTQVARSMCMASGLRQTASRARSCAAGAAGLRRADSALRRQAEVHARLLSGLADQQAAQEDKCPAALREAKERATELHGRVGGLSTLVNATEFQLQVLHSGLAAKTHRLDTLDAWRKEQEEACQEKAARDTAVWQMLREELAQLAVLAGPALAQVGDGAPAAASAEEEDTLGGSAFSDVRDLARDANVAASALASCLARGDDAGEAGATDCQGLQANLQQTYASTYAQLSQLMSGYATLANSTACHAAVMVEYRGKKQAVVDQVAQLTTDMSDKLHDLRARFRPQLAFASEALERAQAHAEALTAQCSEASVAVSDLTEVQETLHAVHGCANGVAAAVDLTQGQTVAGPSPSIPLWTGTYASANFDLTKMSGQQLDQKLSSVCAGVVREDGFVVRPAVAEELAHRSFQGAPVTNGASLPLLARSQQTGEVPPALCWDMGEPLTVEGALAPSPCPAVPGRRAVMCLAEPVPSRQA